MTRIVSVLFVVSAIALFFNDNLNARQCCGGGGMRGYMNYDLATVETVKGTIVALGTFQRGGIHISLKTGKDAIDVHLGPDFYVNDKIKLGKGDAVVVIGSRVKYDGKDAIIAKTLEKGGVTIQLRKDDGTPLWSGEGHRRHR